MGDVSKDSIVKCPVFKILGVDIELGDAKLTGVDKDFDAKPTGVEAEVATNP